MKPPVMPPKDLLNMPLDELMKAADAVRHQGAGDDIELCGIVNAKSGKCGEDCKYCAQSAHNRAALPVYPLKGRGEIVEAAERSSMEGARRFGIVTSGNRLSKGEIRDIAAAMREIRKKTGMSLCASLGAIDGEDLDILKEAGLERYHHNIETSERYYAEIVTTHDFADRLKTIRLAKKAGLEVCSGGIIGLGETWEDRVSMAETLRDLDVDAVPINFLVPVKGTPMEKQRPVSVEEALRTIAIFRLILGKRTIKVAAGRENVFKGQEEKMYMAGANGMMIGGYLTVAGRPVEDDLELVRSVKDIWKNA